MCGIRWRARHSERESSVFRLPRSAWLLSDLLASALTDDIQCHAERDTVRHPGGLRENSRRDRPGGMAAGEPGHHLPHPAADEKVLRPGVQLIQQPRHHRLDQEGL